MFVTYFLAYNTLCTLFLFCLFIKKSCLNGLAFIWLEEIIIGTVRERKSTI